MMTSRLDKVKRGFLDAPLRCWLYGSEGIGKSTLAAYAPDPIFFDLEDGTGRIETSRYPFRDGPDGHVPKSYAEILSALDDLTVSPHDYKTLAIDTNDRLESLIWSSMMARHSGKKSAFNKSGRKLDSIESYGYAKGYKMAIDEWRALAVKLDALRMTRGMNIIMLGHAIVRTFKNPEGEDFDRWIPRVHHESAGFLKEWVDVVGYCHFEEFAGKFSDDDRAAKGSSTGRRLIKFRRTAAYDAKSRIPLPDEIEITEANPWGPFAAALEDGRSMSVERICELIGIEIGRIGDSETAIKITELIAANENNPATLSRILAKARNTPSKEDKETCPEL